LPRVRGRQDYSFTLVALDLQHSRLLQHWARIWGTRDSYQERSSLLGQGWRQFLATALLDRRVWDYGTGKQNRPQSHKAATGPRIRHGDLLPLRNPLRVHRRLPAKLLVTERCRTFDFSGKKYGCQRFQIVLSLRNT
jgi:hypothetical protein